MKRSIEATTKVRAPLEQARAVLADDAATVLAGPCSVEDRRARQYLVTLAVDIGAGAHLQQDVTLEAGRPQRAGDGFAVPVRWHATSHERLVPAFDGELLVSGDGLHTEVALRGSYTVPLGPLGRFGDGLAGRRAARRSLTSYLEQLARRLDAEVDRRNESVGWRPAPYAVSLCEHDARSEHFIG